jgi:endonuclease YncB( thermonuclease family)
MRRLVPVAFLLLSHAATSLAATDESFEARVIGITDGDTITVRIADTPPYTIRLSGIDAPEKQQPFGNRAKQNLSQLVFGKQVRIEWSKKDKYGRVVGKVLVAQPVACAKPPCPATLDANLAQVAAGFAWHYKQYEKEQSKQDRLAYDGAEQRAREQKLGLWSDPHPVPPWEWRHGSPHK